MDNDTIKKFMTVKVPVVPLNIRTDFEAWHLTLRRLVRGYNMGDALMFTVPEDRVDAYKSKAERLGQRRRERGEQKGNPDSALSRDDSALSEGEEKQEMVEDENADQQEAEGDDESSEETATLLSAMGITKSMGEFFSATTKFVDIRDGAAETDKKAFYRQEIWSWMESSLEKGSYKWVARSINPPYDIRALYTKIASLANRATWISYALEFRKVFLMTPGDDIFQYHAEVTQQIKLVKAQGDSLGLKTMITPAMEQCLLLIAAWQLPQYRKIALEFTMDDKSVTVVTLIRELERQRLLTAHLNQAQGNRPKKPDRQADVRQANPLQQPKPPCYSFQKGKCHRSDCPFSHEIKDTTKKKPESGKKKSVGKKHLPAAKPKKVSKKKGKGCYRT